MDKLLIFPGRSDRGIFTHVIDAEKSYLEKTAAEYHPTIAAYINAAKPLPGKTQILLTALGAHEFWGVNANGDAFPEAALAHEGPDYGYKTFELYAKAYKHHVNKDPTAAYGDVPLSVYNPTFHRVELIVSLDNERAPDIVQRIENGDYPDWSMGCLKASARVLLESTETKIVSELRSGDRIVNGLGGVSEVDYPHSHRHKGTWYQISALGMTHSDIEPTTEEHPWLIIRKEDVRCSGNPKTGNKISLCFPNRSEKKTCTSCPNGKEVYQKVWVRADELEVGDYIATPILQGVSETPDKATAYLLGLYLAQGHTTTDGYVCLSVNKDHRHLLDKLSNFFPNESIKWRECENSGGASISIYSKELGAYLYKHAGKYASEKKLSAQVMRWDYESQKIMLGGYCDGDGGVYKDSVYFSTCNRALAEQIQSVLLRVGCISSLNVNVHKPSTVVAKETVEYQVWVGRDTALNLKGYSFKTKDLAGPKAMVKNHRFIYGGHLWSPIIGIDTEECDEDVYNIAVKSDNYASDSYVVNGVALHNCKVPFDICSICGNKAPSRAYYCEHLKYYIGRIHPESGKMAYAINTMPKFFDISQVLIGADRIAKTLMKVASHGGRPALPGSAYLAEKMAEVDKKATIVKDIPSQDPPASQESLERVKGLFKEIPEITARERQLPKEVLDRLGGMPLSRVLSTMTMMGIVPKPQEFQRIYLVGSGHRSLADEMDRRNICFDPDSVEEPSREHFERVGVSYRNFDDIIMRLLCPFMAERSYAAPHLSRRITILLKTAASEAQPTYIKLSSEDERRPIGPFPILLAAAGAYAALSRKAPKEVLSNVEKLLQTPAGLGLATALGLGLIKVFDYGFGSKVKGSYTPGRYENPDVNNAHAIIEEMKHKPYLKTASLMAAAKRLFLGIPAAFMVSGVLQKRREANPYEPESWWKKLLRRYPDVVSGALAVDAAYSARGGGTHGLFRSFKMASEVGDLSKEADIQDVIGNALLMPLAMGPAGLPGRIVGGLFDSAVIEGGKAIINRRKKKDQQTI